MIDRISEITKELDAIQEDQFKDIRQQDNERLKDFIELNAAAVQKYYEFKLKVNYLNNRNCKYYGHLNNISTPF